MEMAHLVSSWSSCINEGRSIGAVIVKDKRVMTTGYNGAAAGTKTCRERGYCLRRKLNIPSGTRTETCYAIHAEQNAVIQAAKHGISIDGAVIYSTHQPCVLCAKILINAGVVDIAFRDPYPDPLSGELLAEAGIVSRQVPEEVAR